MSNAQSLDAVFYSELKSSHRVRNKIKQLSEKSLSASLISIGLNWAVVFGACCLIFKSFWFLPLSLLLIGSRQRGFSNLVHDAAHGNFHKRQPINNFIGNIFCALPMFETVSLYRTLHLDHHRYLGDIKKDPDSKSHLRYGYDDSIQIKGSLRLMVNLVLNRVSWSDSLQGNLFVIEKSELFKLALWWIVLIFSLSMISLSFAGVFLTLWVLSKATTYHLIRLIAEFLDHSGLKTGTQLSFSRTVVGSRAISAVVHPNIDNFHLAHHLLPKIPHYNLKNAHGALLEVQSYAEAHHCDGYVLGQYTAFSSWAGMGQLT